MHSRRLQLGALLTALAAAPWGGSAYAAPPHAKGFEGWTPLSAYVKAGLEERGTFRLVLPTRAGEVEFALQANDVHGRGAHAEEVSAAGERRGAARTSARTFAGGRLGDASGRRRGGDFVRLALAPSGALTGLARVEGTLYDLAADTAAGDLVLAVMEVEPEQLDEILGGCAATAPAGLAAESAGEAAPESAAAGTLREIELGTEADALFVDQTGGTAEANAKIASIVNAINGIYEFDLGLTNKIVFQRTWNGSDPYTSSNSETLLTQFRSSWSSNVAAGTDEAQLFSGRDFESNVVGRAYLDATCGSYRFGVNQYYQQSESLTRLITAHEMGHNLGSDHTADGIMASSINASVTWFSSASQTQIASYLAGTSCLAEVASGGPPLLDPIGPQEAPENVTLQLQLSASDPDGGPIEWAALPLPVGASLSNGGLFSWKPPLDSVGCGGFEDVPVTFWATDAEGQQASETVTLSVLDAPSGSPPSLADPADRTLPAGQSVSFALSAPDDDGDTVSFGAANLPSGASLVNGVFGWTPSEAQLGLHTVTFTATDCTGETSAASVDLTVVSGAPVLASVSSASGTKGQELMLTGERFAGKKVFVYFGPKKAKARVLSDTSLTVKVPKKPTTVAEDAVSLTLLRDGVASSNALGFTYLAP